MERHYKSPLTPKYQEINKMTLKIPPPKQAPFKQECEYLLSGLRIGYEEIGKSFPKQIISKDQIKHIEEAVELASNLHKEGKVDEAWYYLYRLNSYIQFREALLEAKFRSSDEAAASRLGALNGRKGAQKKKITATEAKEKNIQKILSMNEKEPFTTQRQMRDAASSLGPGRGLDHSDQAWGYRLIKSSQLFSIYKQLSSKRK